MRYMAYLGIQDANESRWTYAVIGGALVALSIVFLVLWNDALDLVPGVVGALFLAAALYEHRVYTRLREEWHGNGQR